MELNKTENLLISFKFVHLSHDILRNIGRILMEQSLASCYHSDD